MREREIFIEALQKETLADREAYLAAACEGDPALRSRVERLLAEHQRQGNFLLDAPPPGLGSRFSAETASPGMQIGPYKLLQQIGDGGMGYVYRAEQTEPVERQVALKIIKPGLDTQQVLARFGAERQALARMDHPHIARVLDAGTTANGRPYFVMEFVAGQPISKYCDDHQLGIRQRLELMILVCQAIQHAHQKGIIHRDIKPTNILVAEYDDHPVPKVIDFGVSKAVATPLTEQTAFTLHGQIIGTLEYMSPEQAGLSRHDIDTRSDVYSLGVLLYELLTGTTPFDKHALQAAAFHEVLRIIREDEPPPPSTRLSRVGTARQSLSPLQTPSAASAPSAPSLEPPVPAFPSLASIAAVRRTEPARLAKSIRGELDWIVMKALEKDRDRRYPTAYALASDLERYLGDEPVQACPPSTAYRLGKAMRRYRWAITTAALFCLTLLAGTAISAWQAFRATQAEHRAVQSESLALAHEQRALAAAAAEAQQREQAESQTQEVVRQRQLLEVNQRVLTLVIDEILDVASSPTVEVSQRHEKILSALANLSTLNAQDRVAAYLRIGNLLAGMNQDNLAHTAFDAGLALDPQDRRLLTGRADLHFHQKQFAQAMDDYTRAIENHQHPPAQTLSEERAARLRRAFTLCRLQQFDAALDDFKKLHEHSPLNTMHAFAVIFDGLALTPAIPDSRLAPGILDIVERSKEESQKTTSGRRDRAAVLAHFGHYPLAQEEFDVITASQSASGNDYYHAATIAAANSNHEAYRRYCSGLLKRNGDSLNVFTPWTCALAPAALDDYTPAIDVAREIVKKMPGSGAHHLALGAILFRASQTEEALPVLKTAVNIKRKPKDSSLQSNYAPYFLAMAEFRAGHHQEAEKWLAEANELASRVLSQPGNWRHRVTMQTLQREATALIAVTEPTAQQKAAP